MARHVCIAVFCIVIFITLFRSAESGFCAETYTCTKTCYRQTCTTTGCGWWSRCRRCSQVRTTCYQMCERFVCCEGYNGTDCDQAICYGSTECPNGGICQDPDVCVCLPGYSGPLCDDIDECASGEADCSHQCENNNGTFTCSCFDGYQLSFDGKTCNDVNECLINFGGCPQGCKNIDGSFICSCYDGYVLGWDGRSCLDINECAADTHQCNQTCQNIQGSYTCGCVDGYTLGYDGLSCDDTQPPVMSGCPANISLNATNTTLFYNWTPPTFADPFGNDLHLTQNYPIPNYYFPWGDFTVQYTATKVSNGLSTACIFTIRVRPTPCDDLNIPVNGARICNNWQTDYARLCLVACKENYTLGPAYDFQMIYVCGASGNWLATESVPDCDIQIESLDDTLSFHPEYLKYSYASTSCTNTTTTQQLQELFIERLSGSDGQFDIFCSSFPDECVPANVEVVCS